MAERLKVVFDHIGGHHPPPLESRAKDDEELMRDVRRYASGRLVTKNPEVTVKDFDPVAGTATGGITTGFFSVGHFTVTPWEGE